MTNELGIYLKPFNQTGVKFFGLMAVLLGAMVLGGYALYIQFTEGHYVSGMRDIGSGGAAWGIYIGMLVYFIGISYAGISVSAAVRLLNLEKYKPVARMGELLTIIALLLGSLFILFDLGQPIRGAINMFQFGRPMSPLFFTFSVIATGYLWSTLIFMYISGRRDAAIMKANGLGIKPLYTVLSGGYVDSHKAREKHDKVLKALAVAILPLLVMAHSFLGFVFGLQVGRPGWYTAIQAPAFVTLAAASGIGALIIIALVIRRTYGLQQILTQDIFRGLGNFMGAATGVYIYMIISEMYVMKYAGPSREVLIADSMLSGQLAPYFWTEILSFIAAFLIIFAMFARKSYSLLGITTSAVLVNIGALLARNMIIIPSQTLGMQLPYALGSYFPSWIEISVVVGLFALGVFLYSIFTKIFPIIEFPEEVRGER